jgi:hypothetical protein
MSLNEILVKNRIPSENGLWSSPLDFWVSWVPRMNQPTRHFFTPPPGHTFMFVLALQLCDQNWSMKPGAVIIPFPSSRSIRPLGAHPGPRNVLSNASESSSCSPEAKKPTKWAMDVKNPWQRFRDDWCQYPSAYSIYIYNVYLYIYMDLH